MKKRTKIIGSLGLLIGILVIVGVVFAARKPAAAQYITDTVKRLDLKQTVEATGTLNADQTVDLSFATSGTVGKVPVAVGDTVVAGQVLAMLDDTKQRADVDQAEETLAAAQGSLAAKRAGSTSESIAASKAAVAVAQAAVSSAETDLENARSQSGVAVSQAQTGVTTAQNTVDNTRTSDENRLTQDTENIITVLRANVIAIRAELSKADEILGISNTMANDSFEDVLSQLDVQQLTAADNAYNTAVKDRNAAESAVVSITDTTTLDELVSAISLTQTALEDVANTLLYTRRALDATNVNTAEFSSADLADKKTEIDTARDAIQAEQSDLTTALQASNSDLVAANTNETSASDALTKAEDALTKAEADQTASVSQATSALTTAQANLAQAEAQLDVTSATPRSVDLAALEADVSQAQAGLTAAEARLTDAQIVSPISGTVTRVDVKQGEAASASASVITVQTIGNGFKIDVDVPEADIAKILLGDVADTTFDAFGDNVHVSGSVTEIDPAEVVVQGVTFYKVTVSIDAATAPQGLKPGMTANVTITTASRTQVLAVPQRAVLQSDGIFYVRVPNASGSFDKQTVTVGLRADDGLDELLTGATEGETVILSVKSGG